MLSIGLAVYAGLNNSEIRSRQNRRVRAELSEDRTGSSVKKVVKRDPETRELEKT